MKNLLIILILLIPIISIAQFGGKNFIDQNYIEVKGKAEMSIVPDQIYINIVLKEKDTKNSVSVEELEKRMTARLEQIGIDLSKNLLVRDISSNFKNKVLSKDAIVLSKKYQLLVYDGKTAQRVFIELEKAGISNVSIERLDHSKMVEFRKQVKIDAIKAAKEKASLLAEALDQSIGKAIFIQEIDPGRSANLHSNSISVQQISDVYYSKTGEIGFEKIELQYSMLCRFDLK